MNKSPHDKLVTELKCVDPNNKYYAITLLGTPEGGMSWTTVTHWVGWVDNKPGREIREASIVNPDWFRNFWRDLGESYVFVNSPALFLIYFRLGGNALVEKSVAECYLQDVLKPEETAFYGEFGFKGVSNIPKEAYKKAPTPKHRMRILKRDGMKCKICGRSPNSNTDIELHVHHIRPWSRGGLTDDENLITLCHTCHTGLDPHGDHSLFYYLDKDIDFDKKKRREKYYEGVNLHRQIVSEMFTKLDRKTLSSTSSNDV